MSCPPSSGHLRFKKQKMQFRLSAILALSIGISAAFADDDFGLPDDVQSTEVVRFVPIEATTTVTTDSSRKENPAAFKEHQIPEELNRPLRVGIFTGVKELYFKYQGETVHVTASKNKVKFEAGGNSTEDISREFNSEEGGCLAVAPDTKTLGKACYPGSILFRNTNGKLDAINSVDVEDYLRGVVTLQVLGTRLLGYTE
jgi:stage II sporulation protein D